MRRSLTVLMLLAPTGAFAHTGIGAHGAPFASGLMHPLLGPDHLLTMIAVGLLAAMTRGRALWAYPASFVAAMIAEHGLDRDRVYVTGLSAGGAMTTVMLATYPEMFAGGAIIGGLPYVGAPGVSAALGRMAGREDRGTAALIDSVARVAGTPAGRIPTVSIWHGGADPVVAPGNAAEIVKQWRDVHGLQERPTSERQVDGARHRAWCGRDGTALVESYLVPGLGHGAPVDPRAAEAERRCGAAAPGFPDAGISSTYHIARAWSLAGAAFTARAASR